MRTFEISILAILFLTLAIRFLRTEKRPAWTNYLPGVAILFILIHISVEGFHWQMVPAYFLAAVLFYLELPRLLGKMANSPPVRSRRKLNRIGMAVGLLWLAFAAALPVWVPLFEMPNPSGPYAVGTTSFAFIYQSRSEIFTPDPADKRLVNECQSTEGIRWRSLSVCRAISL